MCGRYGLFTPESELAERFAAEPRAPEPGPRYNLAPTQSGLVCRAPGPEERELTALRWGLIPFWSKDPRETARRYSMINVRADTITEKPAFKVAFRRRRCLVPADGFFEWQARPGGPKQPHWIRLRSGEPMALAGLWERWEGEIDGEPRAIESYTIVVGEPNELMAPIHNRMPVVVDPSDWALWLDPGITEPEPLLPLLRPYPAEAMEAVPVSRRVNSPENDDPALIEAVS